MKIGIRTLIIAVVILAVARLVYIKFWVFGSGAYSDSPNGRYSAEMWTYHGRRYFGGDRVWTVFSVSDGDDVVWEQQIDDAHVDRSQASSVTWTTDSSLVTFVAPHDGDPDRSITLSVTNRSGRFVSDSELAP